MLELQTMLELQIERVSGASEWMGLEGQILQHFLAQAVVLRSIKQPQTLHFIIFAFFTHVAHFKTKLTPLESLFYV